MFPEGYMPPPDRQPTDPDQVDPGPEVTGLTDAEIVMADPLLKHRAKRFAAMGFNVRQARALALNRTVDTHFVEHTLIGRGCEIDIAFDIAM